MYRPGCRRRYAPMLECNVRNLKQSTDRARLHRLLDSRRLREPHCACEPKRQTSYGALLSCPESITLLTSTSSWQIQPLPPSEHNELANNACSLTRSTRDSTTMRSLMAAGRIFSRLLSLAQMLTTERQASRSLLRKSSFTPM